MLSFKEGRPIAKITSGKYKDEIIYVNDNEDAKDSLYAKIDLKRNTLAPIMDPENRSVWYIAGPSGAGKSTFSAALLTSFKKLHPKKPIYFFSRTNWESDPAYAKIKPQQVRIDQSLVDDPVMIEQDIEKGSCTVFDDVNTIHDKQIKSEVFHLVADILEVGRKMGISCIITSHLISGNDRNFSRTVLNELQHLVFFPRGSPTHHVYYALETYFGLSKKKIAEILKIKSRWIVITRLYPMTIMSEHGIELI